MADHSAQTLKDFEQESFVLDKYIEKLTQLDPETGLGPLKNNKKEGMPFDPKILLKSFKNSLSDLQSLSENIRTRVEKYEFLCARQEKEHAGRVRQLEPIFEDARNEFQVLEDRITLVARKVVHLGDQLEASNSHRVRDIDAQRLMEILAEFKDKAKSTRHEFTDPTRLTEGADLINKLNLLVQELPVTEEYSSLRENIASKYADIERQLGAKFTEAIQASDVKRMRMYASTLLQFQKGSEKCVKDYIGHHIHNIIQSNPSSIDDIFRTIETRSPRLYKQMSEVFDNPEDVMLKFLQQAFDRIVNPHISKELDDVNVDDREVYLQRLYDLHVSFSKNQLQIGGKPCKVSVDALAFFMDIEGSSEHLLKCQKNKAMILRDNIAKIEAKIDSTYLTRMIRVSLFGDHLAAYAEYELQNLKRRCQMTLDEFYLSVNIQKKPGGAIRAMIPSGMDGDERLEEYFVSENTCTSILYESKNSIKRCRELLVDRELAHTLRDIFICVLNILGGDHFCTALELAAEFKGGSHSGVFLQVVGCVNKNLHLVEKQFREVILPLIQYPPVATRCNERKREIMVKLEAKIETGIERCVSSMVSTLHSILGTQKKADFKPDEPGIPEMTKTCSKAVKHMNSCTNSISLSLDGKNQEVVLLELGIQMHREIYEHILSFTVNSMGAMSLICDVNEYRRAMKEFKSPFLDEVFANLQTLCNLFIVMHENLKQVCSEEPYVSFDRNVINRMIACRADYKTSKLAKLFNQ